MPDYFDIYQHHVAEYDLLVQREDYQHRLFQALNRIIPFQGLDVVEFGAGTGRLTCLLAPVVRSIRAYDSSQPMLDVAAAKLHNSAAQNWHLAVGDHRRIPTASGSADVALSGWSMCYLALEKAADWQLELDRGLQEMQRVLRPQGARIIIETLGTGRETPEPPPDLREYFEFLERRGFQRDWIRTDYLFQDMDEAQSLTRFFFGEEMIGKIRENEQGIILPECTGLWWQIHHSKETTQ